MADSMEISMTSSQLQQPVPMTLPAQNKYTFMAGNGSTINSVVPMGSSMAGQAVAATTTTTSSGTSMALEGPPSEPIYGTMIPNRVFVGGLSRDTTEEDLMMVFRGYGAVRSTKIIIDQDGFNKGYGFVTFETEAEAQRLQAVGKCIILRNRRLNIAPAVKKQQYRPKVQPLIESPGGLYYSPQAYGGINGMPMDSYAAAAASANYAANSPFTDFAAGPMPAIYQQNQPGLPYQPLYQYYSVPMNMPTYWPPSYYQDPHAINAQTSMAYPAPWEYEAASYNNWRSA